MTALAMAVALARAHGQAPPPRGPVLIERTLAIVGGAVVTQSDVDLAVALGLLTPGAVGTEWDATGAAIDRWLMLHEVARFSPADPDPAAVEAELAAVRARNGGEAAMTAALTRAGFSPARLASWLRDDLRITAYLDQRFASAGVPAEADIARYVENHRADLERDGFAAGDMMAAARARLITERRRDLITDWLADLRRRTTIVEFRRTPG